MTKIPPLLILFIAVASCSDKSYVSDTNSKDSVKLYMDSVLAGKTMAWDNFALTTQAFDSINSADKVKRKYFFDAAVKISNRGLNGGLDAFLSKELNRNVLKYIQSQPAEFAQAISSYPTDYCIDLATGVGIELNSKEKENALTKSGQLQKQITDKTLQADTLATNRLSVFFKYVDQAITAMQGNR